MSVVNPVRAWNTVQYIPVDTGRVPYQFDITLEDRTYTFLLKYNEQGSFYSADLSISATGELLCVGDPIRYGRQMFGTVEDERYPIPVIIPLCLAGDVTDITKDNFGTDVKLYLFERRTE